MFIILSLFLYLFIKSLLRLVTFSFFHKLFNSFFPSIKHLELDTSWKREWYTNSDDQDNHNLYSLLHRRVRSDTELQCLAVRGEKYTSRRLFGIYGSRQWRGGTLVLVTLVRSAMSLSEHIPLKYLLNTHTHTYKYLINTHAHTHTYILWRWNRSWNLVDSAGLIKLESLFLDT